MKEYSSISEKFLSRIVKNVNAEECWFFLSDDGLGYKPYFYFERHPYRCKRVAYLLFNQHIPENPSHTDIKEAQKIQMIPLEEGNGKLVDTFEHPMPFSKLYVFPFCKNNLCINPDHLYLGNRSERMKRLVKSGWARKRAAQYWRGEQPSRIET